MEENGSFSVHETQNIANEASRQFTYKSGLGFEPTPQWRCHPQTPLFSFRLLPSVYLASSFNLLNNIFKLNSNLNFGVICETIDPTFPKHSVKKWTYFEDFAVLHDAFSFLNVALVNLRQVDAFEVRYNPLLAPLLYTRHYVIRGCCS